MKEKLGADVKVATVDASGISLATMSRDIPNTHDGGLLKVVEILPFDEFIEIMEKDLHKKFHGRPSLVESNLAAMRRAYEEVQMG